MEVEVDLEKWQSYKNRGPPRPQSEARRAVIEKQVKQYQELGVIEPSLACEYSQVHMIPKPTTGWRFCLDYVRLNDATIGEERWPIPNIPQMLQRIGNKKAKIFGKMDMTSGYNQAPLGAAARLFSAFICFMGIFQWLRVPIGLKNAAAYFQRVMANVVLVGIIYTICELYIDDVFVFGSNDDEFLCNLRTIFERFQKHNITLQPKKCSFGLEHIEFVGHVVSACGVTFSDEKRKKVLNFPLPTKPKQLHGFLGLVNFFRDNTPDMTGKLKKLRALLDSTKKGEIIWTKELESHFYYVRDEIANCVSLYFLDENAEVFIETDASDFGIGAYIYQIVDGVKKPILFVSKSLSKEQLGWSTIEKEAYAIFYVLKTYDYMFRDIKFTIKTDHANLTYINTEGSAKVRRWKLFLQEFNFNIIHIKGSENFVADAFSRLCSIEVSKDLNDDFALNIFEKDKNQKIPAEQYRMIGSVHNSNIGHFGVEVTLDKLRDKKQTWKYMRRMVRKFIRDCPVCQLLNEKQIPLKVAPFTAASYIPMEVLNIDTIGPLPKDENGNQFILVIIDCFSRWVELYALPDTSALKCAEALLQHCGRFGVPALLRSDQGSQFANDIIGQLCTLLDTDQEFTTAYSKQENTIVERANKEVMRHLRAMMFHVKIYHHWSTRQLPLVMRILNSEIKLRTGVTPAEIIFGNTIDLGRYLLHRPTTPPDANKSLNEHLEKMLQDQRKFIEVAQETQREHDSFHMQQSDDDLTDYPVNSFILWNHPAGGRNKLQTK